MRYTLIEKFPTHVEISNLQSTELGALSALWKEKKSTLEHSGEYKQFIIKMQREWAIETGIIERLYTWDRGVTEILIEQGVDSSIINHRGGLSRDEAANASNLIKDQVNIVESLFSFVKGEQPFSEYYIRSMHMQFTAHQNYTEAITANGSMLKIPLLKGKYKEQPNNPRRPDGEMHAYCPPEFVTDEMEKLVSLYVEHENSTPPEVLSAWVHHRFTQIHPFQDGNGRIARAIASLVFLKQGLFPLVMRESDRKDYIEALEKADHGSIQPLITLFSKRQRDSILSALGIQQQVEQTKHAEQIISSAIALLAAKSAAKQDPLYDVATKLQDIAQDKLAALQTALNPKLSAVETPGATFKARINQAKNGDKATHYLQRQIYEIAKKQDYYANLDRYKSWARLAIQTDKIFEIVFSVHGHGLSDNGVMVVTGFTCEKFLSEDTSSETEATNTKSCSQDIFQFNYRECQENTIKRFNAWMDASITIALAQWQQTIA